MYSGHFNLFGLLEFVARNPILFGEKRGKKWVYGEKVKELIKEVPVDFGGWYLWGKFNDVGWWETVYCGKAGKRKITSLRSRLSDELREEAICFWASVYGREDTLKQFSKLYNGKYDSTSTRSLRKMGAQFVIWVVAEKEISEDEISRQEKIMIRIFRPTHNALRSVHIEADDLTKRIEHQVEDELTKIRRVIY